MRSFLCENLAPFHVLPAPQKSFQPPPKTSTKNFETLTIFHLLYRPNFPSTFPTHTHTHKLLFWGSFPLEPPFFFPQPHRGRRKIRRVASTFNSNFPPRTPIFLLFLHSRHLLSTPRWFSGTKLSPKLQKKEWKN